MFKEDYFQNNVMEASIVCANCKQETTRNQCRSVSISVADLIDGNKADGKTGTSYYCPRCDTFIRYDNDMKLEAESEDLED